MEALTKILTYPDEDPVRWRLRNAGLEYEVRQGLINQIGEVEYACRWRVALEGLTLEERAAIECDQPSESG